MIGVNLRRDIAPVAAVVLLLVLSVTIGFLAYNIRNLNTGEEYVPSVPSSREEQKSVTIGGPPGVVLQYAYIAVMSSLLFLVLGGIIYSLLKKEPIREIISFWDILGYILGGLFLLGMILFWYQLSESVDQLVRFFSFSQPSTGGGEAGPGGQIPESAAPPLAFLFFFLATGITLVIFFLSHFLSALHVAVLEREPAERRKEAATMVRQTIMNLEAGEDFRSAILRCYSEMCGVFMKKGVKEAASTTPREFEIEARRKLGLSSDSAFVLTNLFEEARYSDHKIDVEKRDQAVANLELVRRELEEPHAARKE